MKARFSTRGTTRLFFAHAAMSLVPVLVLGGVLAATFHNEARRRGVAEARREATLVARTALEPLLDGHPLAEGLTASEQYDVSRVVSRGLADGNVLRVRLRGLDGHVVYSDDGSGFGGVVEDEVFDAAHGHTRSGLTHLNADENDTGPVGAEAAEVYLQMRAGTPLRPVGVLEIYLPYRPIEREVAAGVRNLYRSLAIGLGALYVVLFLIAASVSRGLRRESAVNAFLAEHDALTELPNRSLFRRRVEAALESAVRDRRATAVAIVDLDRFKEVNDTLGHQNGDLLLKEIARRLHAHVASGDTVARLGGDEFGLVLRDVAEPRTKLARLRNLIDQEVEVAGMPISLEASIGFVVAPADGTDADELVQRADVAMYVAKARHRGVVRYDRAHDHYDATNLSLVSELRTAIDAGQLVLHYQPKTALVDGRVEAVESLVRWQHPVHGLLYPDRFLPLAEQSELIDRLTDWVLRRALSEMKALGPVAEDLAVAVNVSARNLAHADFAQQVVGVLHELHVPAHRLIIEMTETALLADPARAATVLGELARAGVRVSLDDFGCGQTSLGYLSALPLHELKIDKSFVSDMLVNRAHAAIVRSIVDLGHNLALRVVGEGVETDDVLTILRNTGCDVAQGYLFARPMPVENLRGYLLNSRATQSAPAVRYAS